MQLYFCSIPSFEPGYQDGEQKLVLSNLDLPPLQSVHLTSKVVTGARTCIFRSI